MEPGNEVREGVGDTDTTKNISNNIKAYSRIVTQTYRKV